MARPPPPPFQVVATSPGPQAKVPPYMLEDPGFLSGERTIHPLFPDQLHTRFLPASLPRVVPSCLFFTSFKLGGPVIGVEGFFSLARTSNNFPLRRIFPGLRCRQHLRGEKTPGPRATLSVFPSLNVVSVKGSSWSSTSPRCSESSSSPSPSRRLRVCLALRFFCIASRVRPCPPPPFFLGLTTLNSETADTPDDTGLFFDH